MTSEERCRIIADLHAKGMTDPDIRRETGMPTSTICGVRKKLGLPANGAPPARLNDRPSDEQIAKLRASGMSRRQIAEQCGLAAGTVKNLLEKAQAATRPVSKVGQYEKQMSRFLSAFKEGAYARPKNSRAAETSNRDGRIYGLPVAICTASSLYGA